MSDFFTQAQNFVNQIEGNVDPRTGIFSVAIKIIDFTGNQLRDPDLQLVLSYTPFATFNHGFGEGWSFNWTRYDGRQVYLASGEQYTTRGSQAVVNQAKLAAFKFLKVGQTAYQVLHRDGTAEVLKGEQIGEAIKVPDTIYSSTGQKINLGWTDKYSSEYWISTITDDAGMVLMNVDYSQRNRPIITIWPDSPEAFTISVIIKDNKLDIWENGDYQWTFGYSQFSTGNSNFLSSVSHPSGLKESVDYIADGHTYEFSLDETGRGYFSVAQDYQQQLILAVTAVAIYVRDDPQNELELTASFSPYRVGQGAIRAYNYTTGAAADGRTPCSVYILTENNTGINNILVTVDDHAMIQFLSSTTQRQMIPLDDQGNAAINIVNSVSESVTVCLIVPESPDGEYVCFTLKFLVFP